MNTTSALKGVLLDVDGTLVLSNDVHAQAWVEAFKKHGISVRFEDVRPLIGMGGDKIIPAVSPRLDSHSGLGKQIGDSRQQIFLKRYAAQLKPTPGARALCEHMHAQGLELVVASSAQKEELDALLKVAGVAGLVDAAGGGSNGKKSKPSPDIIQSALKHGKLRPEEALMLGDTPFDVQAASQSNVRTIAFRCGGWNDGRLRGAIAIYDDPADLLAHYEASPLSVSAVTSAGHGRR